MQNEKRPQPGSFDSHFDELYSLQVLNNIRVFGFLIQKLFGLKKGTPKTSDLLLKSDFAQFRALHIQSTESDQAEQISCSTSVSDRTRSL